MAKFERFEDIEAWQKARVLANSIYKLTKKDPFNHDFALRDQIRRAAISVMANISEGFGRKTDKDFANYLYMAKSSGLEVINHLYIAVDQEYISKEQFKELQAGYDQVAGMLINLIRYLENYPK